MFFTIFFSLLYFPDLESIAFRLEKAYFPTWKDMLFGMPIYRGVEQGYCSRKSKRQKRMNSDIIIASESSISICLFSPY